MFLPLAFIYNNVGFIEKMRYYVFDEPVNASFDAYIEVCEPKIISSTRCLNQPSNTRVCGEFGLYTPSEFGLHTPSDSCMHGKIIDVPIAHSGSAKELYVLVYRIQDRVFYK